MTPFSGHLTPLLAALVLAGCATVTGASAPSLVGPTWQWRETLMNDDKRFVAAAPERYTVQFAADGTVRVRADCNRGSGRHETGADLRTIAIGPVATTRMMCPPGSQDAEFLRGLANVSGYRFDGADLVLMLKFDSGTMRFRAAP